MDAICSLCWIYSISFLFIYYILTYTLKLVLWVYVLIYTVLCATAFFPRYCMSCPWDFTNSRFFFVCFTHTCTLKLLIACCFYKSYILRHVNLSYTFPRIISFFFFYQRARWSPPINNIHKNKNNTTVQTENAQDL